jgi:transposase
VISLMRSEGLLPDGKKPTDEELRRFEKQRKEKTISNTDWKIPTDPESKIARMKDGPTYLAHKAEHVLNLDSGIVLKAEEVSDDKQAPASTEDSLHQTQTYLHSAEK